MGKAPELVRIPGFRCDGTNLRRVSDARMKKLFAKLKIVEQDEAYSQRFRRHQDFMWRYYIPIRYRLLLNPVGTLSRLGPGKLVRLLGKGRSPWREKSE